MKFSIITVCKNNLVGLKLTHESIKKQTFSDHEWIVIDGASNDGTIEYLKNIDDTNIRFLSEPDEGLYDAMNKGIKEASGVFMVFMNSGDMLFSENTLQAVAGQIDVRQKTALIYGDALDYEPAGKIHYRKARDHKTIAGGMFTQHQSMYFARFENGNQPFYNLNYKLSADYQFIIQYLKLEKKGYSFKKINQPLSRFELGGLNESKRYLAIKEDFKIRKHDLQLNILMNSFLYLAHFIHTNLKRLIPGVMRHLRYKKPQGRAKHLRITKST